MKKNTRSHTETLPLDFTYEGTLYSGQAEPLASSCREGQCYEFNLVLNNENIGTIYRGNDSGWTIRNFTNQGLTDKIGEEILLWYGTTP